MIVERNCFNVIDVVLRFIQNVMGIHKHRKLVLTLNSIDSIPPRSRPLPTVITICNNWWLATGEQWTCDTCDAGVVNAVRAH
jgi:hypothetical protein